MKKKILFTSPCGPYPQLPVHKDPIDYFYYRNTYKQKVFQLRSFQSWHSLHYLAQNCAVDSCVMENPNFERFKQEVKKGEYGLVAIGFSILLTGRVLEMVEWLKAQHPEIEILLGGYGTSVFRKTFSNSERLRELTDYICEGDGVRFLSKITEKKWGLPFHGPLQQNFLPARNSFYQTRMLLFKQLIVLGGLGCVNACSFCSTSSQFRQRYIPQFNGQELFKALLQQSQKHRAVQSAIIYDEDFLLNKEQFYAFKEAYQSSELANKKFLVTIFASLRSLQQYTTGELLDAGIGTIFIGVESLSEEVLDAEGLKKRKGSPEEIFRHLHRHGINTLGSLIIGWDSQTEAIAQEDSKRFAALNPTFYQVVPLHVVPGTKLWDQMEEEGRISSDYKVELDSITDFNFEAKSFSHEKALPLVFETYERLVSEGGPWPFRMFENMLLSYTHLKTKSGAFKKRAQLLRSMFFPTCLLAFVSRLLFNGEGFRTRWKRCMSMFAKTAPLLFVICLLASPLLFIILSLIRIYGFLRYHLPSKGDQPDFIYKVYNGRM